MLRFAVIADVQYADIDASPTRDYRASIQKYLVAAGEFVAAARSTDPTSKIDFVLQLGDASNGGSSNRRAILELFAVAERAGVRWRHVLGNHDSLVPDAEKPSVYADLNVPKPGYYDFAATDADDASNRWRFVVLNGNEISEYAAETDAERAAARAERERRRLSTGELPANWNGSISRTQLDWLDSRLSDAERLGESVVVCSHFPLFATSRNVGARAGAPGKVPADLPIYFSALGVSTWNGPEVLEILDARRCVRAYFAGHLHEGGYGVRLGVPHVTFRGVVEAEPTAFAFVELTRDKMVVEGGGDQPSFEYAFAEAAADDSPEIDF